MKTLKEKLKTISKILKWVDILICSCDDLSAIHTSCAPLNKHIKIPCAFNIQRFRLWTKFDLSLRQFHGSWSQMLRLIQRNMKIFVMTYSNEGII